MYMQVVHISRAQATHHHRMLCINDSICHNILHDYCVLPFLRRSICQTLDVLEKLCQVNNYRFLRLDGSTPSNRRFALVEQFNSHHSPQSIPMLGVSKMTWGHFLWCMALHRFGREEEPTHVCSEYSCTWSVLSQWNLTCGLLLVNVPVYTCVHVFQSSHWTKALLLVMYWGESKLLGFLLPPLTMY